MTMAAAVEPRETVADALRRASARLGAARVDTARLDAGVLLAHVLGVERAGLLMHGDEPLSAAQSAAFDEAVARRAAREPVSRIVGEREFWSLPFSLSPATLDPRPDSETLIEAVLEARPDRAGVRNILDLGTGSGCLLVAALSEYPGATGVGLDMSVEALRTAEANAARNGVGGRARFVEGGWDQAPGGPFDLILSNPPYIPEGEIDGLAPEVRGHDPRLALSGGADGLDAYRALAPVIADRLAPGGIAAIELGDGQADAVDALFGAAGLRTLAQRRDLGGAERAFVLTNRA